MQTDPLFLAVALPAVVVAAASKAGFGGAGAFVATPFVALVLAPGQTLGVLLPVLIAIDFATLGPYWRRWSGRDAWALVLWGAVGVGLGWAVWGLVSDAVVRLAIGAVALVFVAQRLAAAAGWQPGGDPAFRPLRAGFWGVVAGLTSFVSNAGGPPAAIALVPRRLDKTTYQATTVVVFFWLNLMKAGPFAALGFFDAEALRLSLILLPAAALGVAIGILAHARVPQRAFDAVILVGLAGAGGKLVVDGIAAL
ncbi:MAG: sulfite exporter TauE/SafE family protein [Pseudomonadota bacterium]